MQTTVGEDANTTEARQFPIGRQHKKMRSAYNQKALN